MGRNVNTNVNKAEFAGHTFLTNSFFSVIFLHAWIDLTILGSFSYLLEYVSLTKYGLGYDLPNGFTYFRIASLVND